MPDLTFVPVRVDNAIKPFGYEAIDIHGQTIRGGRRWATSEARDKELTKLRALWESKGCTVEISEREKGR